MATRPIVYRTDRFTKDELKFIKECSYLESLLHSPGWQKVKQQMTAMVDEALGDMKRQGPKTSAEDRLLAQMRWQQRGAMSDTINAWLEAQVELKNELINRITEEE